METEAVPPRLDCKPHLSTSTIKSAKESTTKPNFMCFVLCCGLPSPILQNRHDTAPAPPMIARFWSSLAEWGVETSRNLGRNAWRETAFGAPPAHSCTCVVGLGVAHMPVGVKRTAPCAASMPPPAPRSIPRPSLGTTAACAPAPPRVGPLISSSAPIEAIQ